jgi:signal transduction histidine kinase
LPRIFADRIQLQQLVSNLLINAVQSVGDSGRILVRSRRLAGRNRDAPVEEPPEATGTKEWFQIEVSDTGPGIPPENLDKIFEPYFTTKPEGEGYGLGLAICQEIAASHGGSLHAESGAGQGSCFYVTLPLLPNPGELPGGVAG